MRKQGFLKGSAILIATVAVTKAVGLVYKIPLTSMLGGTGMATYSGAFAVYAPLLAAVVSGISASTARLTAESCAFGRYANLRRIRRVSCAVYCAEGALASILSALLCVPLAERFLGGRSSAAALLALAPLPLLAALLSSLRGYCEGMSNMLPTAVSEIAETLIRALFGIAGAYAVLAYSDSSFSETHSCFGQYFSTADEARTYALPFAAAAAILAGSAATGIAALGTALSLKLKGDGVTAEQLDSDRLTDSTALIAKRLFAFSLPVAAAAVITTLSGMIDLITVSSGLKKAIAAGLAVRVPIAAERLPEFMYGSYTGLALTVTGIIPTFTAMFGKSSLPALTGSVSAGDSRSLALHIRRLLRITAVIAFPAGLTVSVLPRETLSFLFAGRTDEISCTVVPLAVLSIAGIFTAFSLPCLSALQTLGCRLAPVLLMLGAAAVKLTLNLILIPVPALGLTGAALSALAAQAATAIPACILLARRTSSKLPLSL